jgi:peroxiredoxin
MAFRRKKPRVEIEIIFMAYFCDSIIKSSKVNSMKSILRFILVWTVFFLGCDSAKTDADTGYAIDAEITGVQDSILIYLQLVEDGKLATIDSALLSGSNVSFEGALESPQMVYLKLGESRKIVNFFGENSDIKVHVHADSLESTKVAGSIVHDEFLGFKEYMAPIDQRQQDLNTAFREASQNGDQQKMNELRTKSENIYNDQLDMIFSFIDEKKGSYMAPFVISRYLVYELDYLALDSLLQQIDPSVHNSMDYVKLSQRVETLKNVAVGETVTDFTLNDPSGNPVALSSFRGKILLIDFWASWCGPCRRENPNVVKLYNDFNDKGFEILGVSFDEDFNRWVGAIEDDQLTWPHVSDLQGWGSAAGKLYGINSIPATVLVDREGTIIAKNLRGEELRKKLEELYAQEDQNI